MGMLAVAWSRVFGKRVWRAEIVRCCTQALPIQSLVKFLTLDYSPIFRFDIGGLWRDGDNRLRIENLEQRFRPSEDGVLVVGKVELK